VVFVTAIVPSSLVPSFFITPERVLDLLLILDLGDQRQKVEGWSSHFCSQIPVPVPTSTTSPTERT
jgi:hypothetical protein